jgi:alkylated DNA repair dioxygenase AlkB
VDLFHSTAPLALQLPDAQLLFYERLDLGSDDSLLLQQLVHNTQWQEESITVFGKTHLQPRLVAWHGDAGTSYTYSGIAHEPRPWTDTLTRLRHLVEAAADSRFNSVLLNYYRNEHDSMGLHADDEPELGSEPVIASLSLGEQRNLYFRHRSRRELKTFNLALPSGSLLIMKGETQRNWKHGLRKLSRPCGPRVNLTFRLIS